jgi:glycine/D-amino acid oxidase-like deaminating enzyme
MTVVHEPARKVPVAHACDVCVVGGSCTGVFAAIRAARLGASVVIVEKQNAFGGTATNGHVHVWHSLLDTEFERPIIAGLIEQAPRRRSHRGAVNQEGRSRLSPGRSR